MTTLVLLSGGIDSALCLAKVIHSFGKASCLWVDYGQLNARFEEAASRQLSEHYSVPLHKVSVHGIQGSSLVGAGGELSGTDVVVPARNALLASIAMNRAVSDGHRVISIGCNKTDALLFPDCRMPFWSKLSLAMVASECLPRIHTPLISMTKQEIIAQCKEIGVPLDITRSCYSANPTPCGECGACAVIHGQTGPTPAR